MTVLDRDKYLVVSEHGFLIQLEKGDIEKCRHYKGDYVCARSKRPVRSLEKLPRGCPVTTEDTAHTLCPIIWLLTCRQEGIVDDDEVKLIISGDAALTTLPPSDTAPGDSTRETQIEEAGRSLADDEADADRFRPAQSPRQMADSPRRREPAEASPRQQSYSAPPSVSDLEAEARKDELAKEEERVKALWLEVEGRSRAQDERAAQLQKDEERLKSRLEAVKVAEEDASARAETLEAREKELRDRAAELDAKAEGFRRKEESIRAKEAELVEMGKCSPEDLEAKTELDDRSGMLDEREARIKAGEEKLAAEAAEVERLKAEARENHDKAVKLLELVKKKDANVRRKIMELNKAQIDGGPLPDAGDEE